MTTKRDSKKQKEPKASEKPAKSGDIVLPVLPLPEVVIFPNSISPLFVVRPQSLAAVERAGAETSARRRIPNDSSA